MYIFISFKKKKKDEQNRDSYIIFNNKNDSWIIPTI